MKTSELTGTALDWAVAKCVELNGAGLEVGFIRRMGYHPSADWSQGGEIIEWEEIAVWPDEQGGWFASANEGAGKDYHADTPLIAAMRCYVASKLGDEVQLPEELK